MLYRDDLPFWGSWVLPMETLDTMDDLVGGVYIFEFLFRCWINNFSPAYFTSPVTIIDAVSCLPVVFGRFLDATTVGAFEVMRLMRVLRLLRILDRVNQSKDDRGGNLKLFGLVELDESGTQFLGLIIEFLCIFSITAGIIFNFEVL